MKRPEVVLIFHLGSLGDTAVAIPCYREIARRHANAKRYLLTDATPGSGMVPVAMLLQPMGLIDGSISFPMHLRRLDDMRALRAQIVALKPTTLYYLTPEKRLLALVRHCCFFLACGITSIRSVPWTKNFRNTIEILPGTLWETEGSRLLRVVGNKDNSEPPPDSERSLSLLEAEHRVAESHLASVRNLNHFIAVSAGGKFALKDWGDTNWSYLLGLISERHPTLGLVLVGSADEKARNDGLLKSWKGPGLNGCGLFSPRETAAAIARAQLFLGHDTATLHLAAATCTQVIGIYCARDLPGKWFSGRPGDVFFFHQPPCFGCLLEEISECPHDRVCMTAHDPQKILAAVEDKLAVPRKPG